MLRLTTGVSRLSVRAHGATPAPRKRSRKTLVFTRALAHPLLHCALSLAGPAVENSSPSSTKEQWVRCVHTRLRATRSLTASRALWTCDVEGCGTGPCAGEALSSRPRRAPPIGRRRTRRRPPQNAACRAPSRPPSHAALVTGRARTRRTSRPSAGVPDSAARSPSYSPLTPPPSLQKKKKTRRQGPRLPRPRRQGARPDAQGGQAGQEEDAQGPRPEAPQVQPPLRQRRCVNSLFFFAAGGAVNFACGGGEGSSHARVLSWRGWK
jgi:hypothetical protein